MGDLLKTAVEAHGGLDRWNALQWINVNASITGAIWHVKQRPEVLKDVVISTETQRERLVMDFPGKDKRTVFEPERIVIEDAAGALVEARDQPISSFDDKAQETPWDDVQVAFFSGGALWTYLTTPFLYTYPGFVTEELEPWHENGEEWRRLKVTFPDTVASHTREQVSYFGPDGLLRRHDYTVDILDGTTGANYALDPEEINGIVVPTRRRVYGYDSEHRAVKQFLLVAVDFTDLSVS
jgi:hypothetical protein